MFTGIIQETGKILKIAPSSDATIFQIQSKTAINHKKTGQSISVNGICVTITSLSKGKFSFEAMQETLNRTNLKNAKVNDKVNLEPAMTLSQSLDGHFVQGHVDAEGIVAKFSKEKNRSMLRVKFPKQISAYLSFKGSITINGVSLTISDLQTDYFEMDLIPHTLKNTNLSGLKEGDKVNIETDFIAKHIKRLLDHKELETKYEFLKDRNLI
jgi:riboflavin synthase